jgi:hypothetical protein
LYLKVDLGPDFRYSLQEPFGSREGDLCLTFRRFPSQGVDNLRLYPAFLQGSTSLSEEIEHVVNVE